MSIAEQIFYENDQILITNTRMSIRGTTYATANVTSVSTYERKPGRALEVILIILGIILLLSSKSFGIVLIGIAVAMFFLKKTRFIVKLATAGSERNALLSDDKEFVQTIIAAINKAIIYRG